MKADDARRAAPQTPSAAKEAGTWTRSPGHNRVRPSSSSGRSAMDGERRVVLFGALEESGDPHPEILGPRGCQLSEAVTGRLAVRR